MFPVPVVVNIVEINKTAISFNHKFPNHKYYVAYSHLLGWIRKNGTLDSDVYSIQLSTLEWNTCRIFHWACCRGYSLQTRDKIPFDMVINVLYCSCITFIKHKAWSLTVNLEGYLIVIIILGYYLRCSTKLFNLHVMYCTFSHLK